MAGAYFENIFFPGMIVAFGLKICFSVKYRV